MVCEITTNQKGDLLYVRASPLDVEKCRSIPQRRWVKTRRVWSCHPSLANIEYIDAVWPEADWNDPAQEAKREAIQRAETRKAVIQAKESDEFGQLDGVPFKHPPFNHQKRALLLGRDQDVFAYLMEQGTGKTKVLLDDAAHNFRAGKIDSVVVISPNSVKMNWVSPDGVDEVSNHVAPDVQVLKGVWVSQPNKKERKAWDHFLSRARDPRYLKIISFNVEAMTLGRVVNFLEQWMDAFKTMLVVDESTRIKSPGATRTKRIMKLAKLAHMRRILTGTPIAQSPADAFSQFKFLDEDILGFSSFYAFRNHFCIMGGYEGKQVVAFKNLDQLSEKISSMSYRVLKEDCLDLPPKLYSKRYVSLTTEQERAYKEMKEEMLVKLEEHSDVKANIVMTQLLRLQEIVGGYLPELNEVGERIGTVELIDPAHNPKFAEALDIIENSNKVIVWSRFRGEINGFEKALQSKQIPYVVFHGGVAQDDRIRARERFQHDEDVKVFLGNPQAGGIGINLFAASTCIYLSNSFSLEERLQSEDRCHRIGSQRHNSVNYYDLVATGTIDVKIINALRSNKKIADEVMQDGYHEWIA